MKNTTTRSLTVAAMLSAVAFILQFIEFPLPMLIPSFVKMDFSDLPALLGAYALGPVYGVVISFMKNLLHIVIKGTSTACVGELCNFLLGAVFAGNMNALIFSLLGGVTAMGVMIALSRLKRLSVYGVSVGGAAAHNCGQVAAAVLTLGNTAPLYYLPVLLGVSLFTGALTGLIAACLFRALAHTRLWGV